MIAVLVGQEDRRHLLRPVAERGKCLHIAGNIFPREQGAVFVRHLFRRSRRKSGIHKNHLITGIDQVVLKAAPIADVRIELVRSFKWASR